VKTKTDAVDCADRELRCEDEDLSMITYAVKSGVSAVKTTSSAWGARTGTKLRCEDRNIRYEDLRRRRGERERLICGVYRVNP